MHPFDRLVPRYLLFAPRVGARALAVLAAVSCAISFGCRGRAAWDIGTIEDLSALNDRFSPARPAVVVPDRFWEVAEDERAWVFRGYADLLCYLEDPPGDLELRLVPTEATLDHHFMASWNGAALWPAPRRMAAGGEIVRVPAAELVPGMNRLSLRRDAAADEPEVRAEIANAFAVISYRAGAAAGRVDPSDAGRYEIVRAFLEDGVTGASGQKHGGWLAAGTARATARLTLEVESVASFELTSFGETPAQFRLHVDGTEHALDVGPRETARWEVELGRGDHRLEWSVRAEPDRYYLWGAPHVRPRLARAGRERRERGPVILITMDTTRRDALSVYGGPDRASPNIARLASRGTTFDNAWSTSPWTLPSHTSIFTGLYPSRHGAGVSEPRLSRDATTLAELFRRAGYRTAGFAGGEMSASHWGVAQGFDAYRDPEGFETDGERLTGHVDAFLGRHRDEPFFLFANYFDPHALYRAPAPFDALFGVSGAAELIPGDSPWRGLVRRKGASWRAVVTGDMPPSADALAYLRAAYHAEVAFMDSQIGSLLDWLEDNDLFDAATIVLVADHGELLGENGFFSHAGLLEPELTHIPMIVKWPYQQTEERVDALVSQVDLFATLASIASETVPENEGLTLAPEARGAIRNGRRTVLIEEHEMRIHPLFENMKVAPHLYAIQQASFRQLVWRGGTSCHAAATSRWIEAPCPVEAAVLLEQLEALTSEEETDGSDDGLGDDMRRRLEALGYLP